jgi:hypothetical protein
MISTHSSCAPGRTQPPEAYQVMKAVSGELVAPRPARLPVPGENAPVYEVATPHTYLLVRRPRGAAGGVRQTLLNTNQRAILFAGRSGLARRRHHPAGLARSPASSAAASSPMARCPRRRIQQSGHSSRLRRGRRYRSIDTMTAASADARLPTLHELRTTCFVTTPASANVLASIHVALHAGVARWAVVARAADRVFHFRRCCHCHA